MAKYRKSLPQLADRLFLTDGGMETTFVFHDGIDLPHFASCVLLETHEGRTRIRRYFDRYLSMARSRGLGFVLDTPTWRANPDWGALLGYDAAALAGLNRRAVEFVAELRERWEAPGTPVVLNGVIGPRGDGYKEGAMDAGAARDYHRAQVETFAGTDADMISAITMNRAQEAAGIALAALECEMPCVISYTVETDGRLIDGTTLRSAIESVDEASSGHPAYYMINCAHPSHFADALESGEAWTKRIRGLRANASRKSHAELDESTEIDIGNPGELASDYRRLAEAFPALSVMGGCCGTDHRHVAAICEAVAPPAMSA